MAGYEELGGVRTWYDERGEGEPLALLHPGGADARAWAPNLDALAAHFHVFTPERRGHGRTPDVEGPITYELMAADTIAFLEGVVGGPAHLVGCSAGANVALLVPLRRPDLARRTVLVSGVFHRDGVGPRCDRSRREPARGPRPRLRGAITRRCRPLPGGEREAGTHELGRADARRLRAEWSSEPNPGHDRRR